MNRLTNELQRAQAQRARDLDALLLTGSFNGKRYAFVKTDHWADLGSEAKASLPRPHWRIQAQRELQAEIEARRLEA